MATGHSRSSTIIQESCTSLSIALTTVPSSPGRDGLKRCVGKGGGREFYQSKIFNCVVFFCVFLLQIGSGAGLGFNVNVAFSGAQTFQGPAGQHNGTEVLVLVLLWSFYSTVKGAVKLKFASFCSS